MKTVSEIVIPQLTARCAELHDSLRAANRRGFHLLSAVGNGDVTEQYREGLRIELAACLYELACWRS